MNRGNDYTKYKDEELVFYYRNGDLDAQEFLISKYKNLVKIKSRTYFIIGADNDDLIQEGMIGLFKSIRDYDLEKNIPFYAFAELCITRQIITAIKSATRQKHIPLNSYISLNKQVFDNNEEASYIDYLTDESILNPEDLLIGEEGRKVLEKYIEETLSNMESDVLELYLQGLSYNEIGEKMAKDNKAIDNTIQRIRRKIDKAVNKG